MENYSLSDIAAVSDKNDTWGGNSAWVLIILFALIFGWGGNGFGGRGNGAITEAEMCNMSNFNQLENAVGRLSDQANTQQIATMQGFTQLGYQSLEQANQLGRDLCQGFANGVATTNAVGANLERCCCDTNRNIDAVRYENAMNTAAINANIDAKFAALEKGQLEQTIAAQQNQINQLQLQSQLCGVIRYPNSTTFNAGFNPFFGHNCGCGCSC